MLVRSYRISSRNLSFVDFDHKYNLFTKASTKDQNDIVLLWDGQKYESEYELFDVEDDNFFKGECTFCD